MHANFSYQIKPDYNSQHKADYHHYYSRKFKPGGRNRTRPGYSKPPGAARFRNKGRNLLETAKGHHQRRDEAQNHVPSKNPKYVGERTL
jgi:hypothetical protein